jgi:hypothetical protein
MSIILNVFLILQIPFQRELVSKKFNDEQEPSSFDGQHFLDYGIQA